LIAMRPGENARCASWQAVRRAVWLAMLSSLTLLGGPAYAQEKAADVKAYCIKTYGEGTLASFDQRDNSPMCSERSNQGRALLHHRLNPADICSSQHQTTQYRKEGRQIFCVTGKQKSLYERKVDLSAFCKRNFGQDSFVSRRLTDNAPLCTVKGNSGLSQSHHIVDLAEVCGRSGSVGPDAIKNDLLDCSKLGSASVGANDSPLPGAGNSKQQSGNRRSSAAHSADEERRTQAKVPDSAFVKATDQPDLTGCGHISGKDKDSSQLAYHDKRGRGGMGWQFGGTDTPCKGLGEGLAVDLNEFCNRVHKDQYYHIPYSFRLTQDSGRPVCDNYDGPTLEADFRNNGLDLIWACLDAYPGKRKLSDVGKAVVRYTSGKLECFYMEDKPKTLQPASIGNALMLWADE